jgi:DNA-binding transcriptional regulator YdaS (Cro superfamily)
MDQRVDHLNKAIKLLGGLQEAQRLLGLNTYQSIQAWRRSRVPAEYCPTIEKATGGQVRCEDLRPDMDWAYLRSTDCQHHQKAA